MCSTSQPDDPIWSKHVAVRILYTVVFDGYLFAPYFRHSFNLKRNSNLHNTNRKKNQYIIRKGQAVAQLVEALQVGMSRVRFPMVSLEFFIDIILLVAL